MNHKLTTCNKNVLTETSNLFKKHSKIRETFGTGKSLFTIIRGLKDHKAED